MLHYFCKNNNFRAQKPKFIPKINVPCFCNNYIVCTIILDPKVLQRSLLGYMGLIHWSISRRDIKSEMGSLANVLT
jgi:hypothetical protein